MASVTQPSAMPTRKLTAAMASASLAGIIKAVVINSWPHLADPVIWEPLPYLLGFLAGYVIKDAPNA
jgi:hypothetical protein